MAGEVEAQCIPSGTPCMYVPADSAARTPGSGGYIPPSPSSCPSSWC